MAWQKRQLTAEETAARDARRDEFKALAARLAAMDDSERQALADSIGGLLHIEGKALSVRNMAIIAMQCPNATMIGGFNQWIKSGRAVRKGERGLKYFAPMKFGVKNAEGEKIGARTGFGTVTVFDVSQTEVKA